MGISNTILLISGISLFLFGMTLMGDGLKKVAGSKLELFLYKLTSNAGKGILLGTGVTAVIQSSSATSIMVIGFVNSGMMKLKQAIAVILGAILGTSVTGWVICLSELGNSSSVFTLFSTKSLAGICAIIGIIPYFFMKGSKNKNIGSILLGFAVLLNGMEIMSSSVIPLRESQTFIDLMLKFSNPLFGIFIGLAFTCIIQSASAAVGILQALAVTGVINFSIAFPIIIGIGVGAAVPVIISSLGARSEAKRAAYSYVFINVVGALAIGTIFYILNSFLHFEILDLTMTMVSVALLNTIYRLIIVIALAPILSLIEKLLVKFIPDDQKTIEENADFNRLDERFLSNPSLAIEQAKTVTYAMVDKVLTNLIDAFSLIWDFSMEKFEEVAELEDSIDRYEDKLGTYLMKITSKELDHKQTEDTSKYLHTIGDIERIGDHSMNLAETALEIHNKKIAFSEYGDKEMRTMAKAVSDIAKLTFECFKTDDTDRSQSVEPFEDLIDALCDEMKLNHIERLNKGQCTLDNGFPFSDFITNCERVADHCSNIAIAVIELESDVIDPHKYLIDLKEKQNDTFEKYYNEYKEKYVF